MGVRKLYIDEEGLDVYVDSVYKQTEEDEATKYADIIECKNQVMAQFKLASKLPKIKSISITKDGSIRFRTLDLFISTTDCDRLRKWFVGKWEVEVSKYGGYHFKSLNKKELGFHSPVWGEGTVHPHISGRDGHGCLGNAETGLQYYLKIGAVKALAIFLIGYLESVNLQDSAGVTLGYCKEVELDKDGNPIVEEDGSYKEITDTEFSRNNSRTVSRYCPNYVDKLYNEYLVCEAACPVCGEYHNKSNLVYLDSLSKYVCPTCVAKLNVCDICGEIIIGNSVVNVVTDAVNDKHYCIKCVDKYLPKCELCDEYIIPKFDDEVKDIYEWINKTHSLEFMNTNKVYYRDTEGNGKVTFVCDKCKPLLNNNDNIKDNVRHFTRAKLNKDKPMLFPLLEDIPVRTFTIQCPSCGNTMYIEDAFFNLEHKRLMCSKCAPKTKEEVYSLAPIKALYKQQLDNTINLLQYNTKDSQVIQEVIDNINHMNRYAEVINKDLLTDEFIDTLNESNNHKIEFEIEEKDRLHLEEPNKDTCLLCNEVIDGKIYLDKYNNKYCETCAATVANRCTSCGKCVPITKLGRNNAGCVMSGRKSMFDVCNVCRGLQDRNEVGEPICPSCGEPVLDSDDTWLDNENNMTYHFECAQDNDIIRYCDACSNYYNPDEVEYCEENGEYLCEYCLHEYSYCNECDNIECPHNPDY